MNNDKRVTPKTAKRVTDDRALYVISVAAELAGVHPQTLRLYERKGLVSPARTSGNSRRYSARDIERVRLIQSLTQEGMSLAAAEIAMKLQRDLEAARDRLATLQDEMNEARREMAEMLAEARRARGEMMLLRDATGLPGFPDGGGGPRAAR